MGRGNKSPRPVNRFRHHIYNVPPSTRARVVPPPCLAVYLYDVGFAKIRKIKHSKKIIVQ
nr:MAG TPA: hypothetical protein [Caudoviricetes sp.]